MKADKVGDLHCKNRLLRLFSHKYLCLTYKWKAIYIYIYITECGFSKLLQLCDYPSQTNSKNVYTLKQNCCFSKLFGYYNCVTILPVLIQKNVVVVKQFVGG